MSRHSKFTSALITLVIAGLILFAAGPTLAASQSSAAAVPAASYGTATVLTHALNVRSGPGTNYGIVAVVRQGQQLALLGRNAASTWVKVQIHGGQQGWVNASLVRSSVAIGSLPVVDSSADGPSAVVATSALNVRSGPGVGYARVAVLSQGARVSLLGRNSAATWAKVRLTNGTQGWVNASFLRANVAIGSLPVVDGGPPGGGAMGTVVTYALNVRSGPGVNYGVVAVLSQGQTVTLLGRNSAATWAKVRIHGGTEGWVNASLIRANIAIINLPVVDVGSGGPHAVVNTYALNVRSGPGVGYARVAVLSQGSQVTLIGRNGAGTWVKMRLASGQTGWANASYLYTSANIWNLPVVG